MSRQKLKNKCKVVVSKLSIDKGIPALSDFIDDIEEEKLSQEVSKLMNTEDSLTILKNNYTGVDEDQKRPLKEEENREHNPDNTADDRNLN